MGHPRPNETINIFVERVHVVLQPGVKRLIQKLRGQQGGGGAGRSGGRFGKGSGERGQENGPTNYYAPAGRNQVRFVDETHSRTEGWTGNRFGGGTGRGGSGGSPGGRY